MHVTLYYKLNLKKTTATVTHSKISLIYKYQDPKITCANLIFIGPCITVIDENKRPTWCHLLLLFHFLCAQHVSDFNVSVIRSLQLICWITTLVVCSWFDVCWCFGVVGLAWYPCCRLQYSGRTSYTQWTKDQFNSITNALQWIQWRNQLHTEKQYIAATTVSATTHMNLHPRRDKMG